MSKVIVIGAGAAGLMATYSALLKGNSVDLYDKNEKCGKKIYITGKGRCNLTNDAEIEDYFKQIPHNHKFLYSSLYQFTNNDTKTFFENHGCPIKVERGLRVFPESNHAYDVTNALERTIKEKGGHIYLNARLDDLIVIDGIIKGVVIDGKKHMADAVILAMGGFSYPSTGSTGEGFAIVRNYGHHTSKFYPSLVPFVTKEEYVLKLQGLSLKNVEVTIMDGHKKLYNSFGEMLFTHFGVSGPLILSASSLVTEILSTRELQMEIDLKPALDVEKLSKRVIREFEYNRNKQFKTICSAFFPTKLIPIMIELSGIDENIKINEITKEQRDYFIHLMKHFPMTIVKTRDFNEAIITRGGVLIKEINPSNMESKIVKGLYFAGEMIDVDAYTGGFNLQIAWSTGYLAGMSIGGESNGI